MKILPKTILRKMVAIFGILVTLGACTPASFVSGPTPAVPAALVEVTFQVKIPEDNTDAARPLLEVLDTVTGLAINPTRFVMEKQADQNYAITVPFPAGSVIQYRYALEGTPPLFEHNAENKQILFRAVYARASTSVKDVVVAWRAAVYQGKTGRIFGKILDAESKEPLGGIYVTAAGQAVLSSQGGQFVLNNVPVGTHLLTFIHPNGSYEPLSQEAVIADQAGTPANVSLAPRPMVEVEFVVTAPANTPVSAPLRIVGNTLSLGNAFTDLRGGMSILAASAPVLTRTDAGSYHTTLKLPAGADIRYKYTLGDGFWNAEHKDGRFLVRQLIVPPNGVTLTEEIQSWQIDNAAAPIGFNITLPSEETTPPGIQFNPFAWMEPLPAWPAADPENSWEFILFSPLEFLGDTQYRICRANQCPAGLELLEAGKDAHAVFNPRSLESAEIAVSVESWLWDEVGDVVTPDEKVEPREMKMTTGVELNSHYQPGWQSHLGASVAAAKNLSANTLLLTPAWPVSGRDLPEVGALPGKTIWDQDILALTAAAGKQDIQVWLYPQLDFPVNVRDWLAHSNIGAGWWQTWFDRMEDFALHYAILAEAGGAEALVLGEPGYLAAQIVKDDEDVILPADIEERWLAILKKVRKNYSGEIYLALPYPLTDTLPAKLLESVDGVYLLWTAPVNGENSEDVAGFEADIKKAIKGQIGPLAQQYKLPVVLGLSFASQEDAARGCSNLDGVCVLDEQPSLDFGIQNSLYRAALRAVESSTYITGVVTRGYYPPAPLPDGSPSVHGKPVEAVIHYWFSQWNP